MAFSLFLDFCNLHSPREDVCMMTFSILGHTTLTVLLPRTAQRKGWIHKLPFFLQRLSEVTNTSIWPCLGSPSPKISDTQLYEISSILLSQLFKKRGCWCSECDSYLQGSESSRTTEWERGDCGPETGSFSRSWCIPHHHPAESRPSLAPSQHRGLLFLLFLQASPMAKQKEGAWESPLGDLRVCANKGKKEWHTWNVSMCVCVHTEQAYVNPNS